MGAHHQERWCDQRDRKVVEVRAAHLVRVRVRVSGQWSVGRVRARARARVRE